jgi:hypothetical protein
MWILSIFQWKFQEPIDWRYLPYVSICKANFSGLCKGIYPQNMAKHMVQYPHFRILEFPLNFGDCLYAPFLVTLVFWKTFVLQGSVNSRRVPKKTRHFSLPAGGFCHGRMITRVRIHVVNLTKKKTIPLSNPVGVILHHPLYMGNHLFRDDYP